MPEPSFHHTRLARRLDLLIRGRLWLKVTIGLAAGAGLGLLLGPDLELIGRRDAEIIGNWLALPGQLFLALIGMVIIPLAASSIVLGITGTGGGETLRAVGVRLGVFVVLTTMMGAALGVAIAKSVRPGRGIVAETAGLPVNGRDPRMLETFGAAPNAPETPLEMMTRVMPDMLNRLIPQNLTQSLLERDVLAVVLFSLFVGIAVVNADKRELTQPIVALAQAILEVAMTVIRTAMRMAPFAVFGLIADTVATNGMQTLADLAVYCAVVLAGLSLLMLVYLAIVGIFGGLSPIAFLAAAGPVQLLAFSTSSSAAVMPLTMKTAVEKLGVAPPIAGAVIPLASTVNMAGTALYQAAAIVFLAQSAGTYIPLGDLVLIMITLTGASIGAPAAPGASIAILSAIAVNFGVPLYGLPLIVGVDRILDMARTTVNVTGDLVACRVLAQRISLAPGRSEAQAPTTAPTLPTQERQEIPPHR